MMLQPVSVGHKSLADYTHLVGRELIEEVRELAEPLKGARLLNVSATAFGGGVAELLYSAVPLLRDIGIDTDWEIVLGREEFFNVTKILHNALQGNPRSPTDAEWAVYDEYSDIYARELRDEYDFVIIHDPQPLPILERMDQRHGRWIWRCHIDLSAPNPDVLDRIAGYASHYDLAVFHVDDYKPPLLDIDTAIVFPGIDPLTPKNMALSMDDAKFVCNQFGVDVDRPLICQVSRFDPWKDPMGVIDAYRMVADAVPGVQLALVGSMASDDPEGWEFFRHTYEYAAGDPDIKILNNLNNVGAIEVNAFQSYADVILQKSIREGFGLTVTEAMWKGKPTVAGDVGGIPLQIEDGRSGFLVDSIEDTAKRSVEILRDPDLGRALGKAAKERARKLFLTPRLLRDWLRILGNLPG